VKTLIGFALGSLLSLGMITSALASGTNVAAPASVQTARTLEPRGTFLSVSLVSSVWSENAR